MREEARRAAAFEEAGRLAQRKLIEEANRLEAERIAEEARLVEQREVASRRLNTEVAPTNHGSQADQIVGKRISLLMNNSRLRYMGTVLLVTMDSILLQSVTSHGTEGRFLALASPQPGKDVAAEFGVVHSQMRFVKTDIKDLHIHDDMPAKAVSSLQQPSNAELYAEVGGLKSKNAELEDKFWRQARASADKIAALERQMRSITSRSSSVAESPNNSATNALLTGGNECVICLDGPKTIVLFPCKHLCLCSKCSVGNTLKTCPICMKEVEKKLDIVPT